MARKRHRRKRKLSRTQRLRRRFDKDPFYNPGVQLGGWRLRSAARKLTDFEFGPQRAELDRQSGTVTRQGHALMSKAGDYYRQLAAQEAQGMARQAALSGGTNNQLAAIAAQTQGQIQGAQQQAGDARVADAAQRGQGLQGGNQMAQELAAARAGAASSAQAYRSTGVLQGANYQGLAAAQRTSRQLRGGEIQGELANRIAGQQAEISGKRRDLAAQEGPALSKHVLDLRQQGFENLATMEGLGIKKDTLQANIESDRADRALAKGRLKETSRSNRARERIARINSQIAAGNLSERQRHDLETERAAQQRIIASDRKAHGGGGHTKKYWQHYDKAYSLVRSASGKKGRVGSARWRKQTLDYLVGTKGLSRSAAHRAITTYFRRWHKHKHGGTARFGPH